MNDLRHFYELDLPARQKLVSQAFRERATLVSRWATLSNEWTESWDARAQRAAGLIGDAVSVMDIGCGMMTLEKHLRPGVTYTPLDVVRRDERTLVIDLNKDAFPPLGADVAVGLGLIEYIYDTPKLLRSIAEKCERAVFSYNSLDDYSDVGERVGHAWVTYHSLSTLEALFREAGFRIIERVKHDTTQTMWLLRRV